MMIMTRMPRVPDLGFLVPTSSVVCRRDVGYFLAAVHVLFSPKHLFPPPATLLNASVVIVTLGVAVALSVMMECPVVLAMAMISFALPVCAAFGRRGSVSSDLNRRRCGCATRAGAGGGRRGRPLSEIRGRLRRRLFLTFFAALRSSSSRPPGVRVYLRDTRRCLRLVVHSRGLVYHVILDIAAVAVLFRPELGHLEARGLLHSVQRALQVVVLREILADVLGALAALPVYEQLLRILENHVAAAALSDGVLHRLWEVIDDRRGSAPFNLRRNRRRVATPHEVLRERLRFRVDRTGYPGPLQTGLAQPHQYFSV
mmetsp:Transcript_13919/g.34379  ORF Transcript_13919/g.34379 Transcript_13919/m.34379 type:complete len:314 (-) Transcript_13919:85-1026(-)